MKMIISEEEKERYLYGLELLIKSNPYESIKTIFGMSIWLGGFHWNDEDDFDELFDDYTKDIPILGNKYFQHPENSKDSDLNRLSSI